MITKHKAQIIAKQWNEIRMNMTEPFNQTNLCNKASHTKTQHATTIGAALCRKKNDYIKEISSVRPKLFKFTGVPICYTYVMDIINNYNEERRLEKRKKSETCLTTNKKNQPPKQENIKLRRWDVGYKDEDDLLIALCDNEYNSPEKILKIINEMNSYDKSLILTRLEDEILSGMFDSVFVEQLRIRGYDVKATKIIEL